MFKFFKKIIFITYQYFVNKKFRYFIECDIDKSVANIKSVIVGLNKETKDRLESLTFAPNIEHNYPNPSGAYHYGILDDEDYEKSEIELLKYKEESKNG